MIKQWIKKILGRGNFNSAKYWEKRYATGGNSGDGSYGRLADFKAGFLNDFVATHNISSVIEFGCGDGNQLSLINYSKYTGLDISETTLEKCKTKFHGDRTKNFMLYKSGKMKDLPSADLTLSLDVIFHLVEDKVFNQYIDDLLQFSKRYVIIYSTNYDYLETTHVLNRKFTDTIAKYPAFKLIEERANPFPGTGEQESDCNFFVYEKQQG